MLCSEDVGPSSASSLCCSLSRSSFTLLYASSSLFILSTRAWRCFSLLSRNARCLFQENGQPFVNQGSRPPYASLFLCLFNILFVILRLSADIRIVGRDTDRPDELSGRSSIRGGTNASGEREGGCGLETVSLTGGNGPRITSSDAS